jgi:hypothetical protein
MARRKVLNILITNKWYRFKVMDMEVTLIWSLYNVYMYWNNTLYTKKSVQLLSVNHKNMKIEKIMLGAFVCIIFILFCF